MPNPGRLPEEASAAFFSEVMSWLTPPVSRLPLQLVVMCPLGELLHGHGVEREEVEAGGHGRAGRAAGADILRGEGAGARGRDVHHVDEFTRSSRLRFV